MSTDVPVSQIIEADQLKAVLPHRYPFLMIDRVLAWDAGRFLRGIKNVTMNEPFFQGHFPSRAIMPGVLIIEVMAQAGGILDYLSLYGAGVRSDSIYFYLAGLDKLRLRRLVLPGDQLEVEVELLKRKQRVTRMQAQARVRGKLVASSELLIVLAPDT